MRKRKGKEHPQRWKERLGFDASKTPTGKLAWIHAASVGESLSILPLLKKLQETYPEWRFLLTTGTLSSAKIMAERLPPDVLHRFVPVDIPGAVNRFFNHWTPDAAIFVEEEIWPGLVLELRARRIPAALVNARLSPRSGARWRRMSWLARMLFDCFQPILAQSEADVARFKALGLVGIEMRGNLKYASAPLPVDEAVLAELQGQVGDRPVLVAASLHPGEETQIAEAHRQLAARHPDLLTILVPKHPARGAEWSDALGGIALRSRRDPLPPGGLYIADTIGELGLWYRLASAAFVGGSLIPFGGQNPLEPTRFGVPTFVGPYTGNFEDMVSALADQKRLQSVSDAAGLADGVASSLGQTRLPVSAEDGARIIAEVAAGLAPIFAPDAREVYFRS
ncbi:3-deoxy-D-manno-octulosonic acid transferase [Lacibacterium aquatile]|uniref:3-deoxy-D-manno-octulosonic acid transferase n=1 Tax=Lacibacterium aquatile TaxID=1168082 RepID=A0ABW5DUW4_9PROT